jgi:hypothetical protein
MAVDGKSGSMQHDESEAFFKSDAMDAVTVVFVLRPYVAPQRLSDRRSAAGPRLARR